MKEAARWIAKIARSVGFLSLVRVLNSILRWLTARGHRGQYLLQWGVRPNPEWFDHFLDQHWRWRKTGFPYCWERGIFGLLSIRQGAKLLELCCGDGFNSKNFYACRAGHVTAVDLDPHAIRHARRHHRAKNIDFLIADIRSEIPQGTFDNIVWDAAIEHFKEIEIRDIMKTIKSRLAPGGVLSGYTLIEAEVKAHHEHEREFRSKADLASFLAPDFANVRIFETRYPDRHNLYFFASEGSLPFDASWPDQLTMDRRGTSQL